MSSTGKRIVWFEALKGMPSLDEDEWRSIGPISRALVATRAAVLAMTLLSCAIAVLFAWQDGLLDVVRGLGVTIALLLAHATNNILNDVSDHVRGVDKGDAFRTRYGTQPVEQGFITVKRAYVWAACCGVPAVAIGIWLCLTSPPIVWVFFLSGIGLVFGYNWPLKHYGLGEPSVVVAWGPLMVGGGYLAITGVWSTEVALASVPYALGPTTVLLGKHTDKLPWDTERGVRTLPVLIGAAAARHLTLLCVALQYLVVAVLYFVGWVAWPALLALVTAHLIPRYVKVLTSPPPDEAPDWYPEGLWPLWYSAHAFVHSQRFGALYLLGLAVGAFMAT